jgi:hypothetical protein
MKMENTRLYSGNKAVIAGCLFNFMIGTNTGELVGSYDTNYKNIR